MRYVPYNGAGATPDWLLDPPPAPRVCLTWGGTTAKGLGPALLDSVRQVLAAVRGLAVGILVGVGELFGDLLWGCGPRGVGVEYTTHGLCLYVYSAVLLRAES